MQKKHWISGISLGVLLIGYWVSPWLSQQINALTKQSTTEIQGDYYERGNEADYLNSGSYTVEKPERIPFDPQKCKTDAEDMLYVSLGKSVLRFSPKAKLYLAGLAFENRVLPKRPDPTEVEGCPTNPAWAGAIAFEYRHNVKNTSDNTAASTLMAEKILLSEASPDYFGGQPFNETGFELLRSILHACEDMAQGFVVCRGVKHKTGIPPKDNWSEKYQAKTDVYTAPMGRPFVAACISINRDSPTRLRCEVEYKLRPTLNLRYRFYLDQLPFEHLIAYDKGLRDFIVQGIVPVYPWPGPMVTYEEMGK